jgi:hypothetical protein
MFVYLDDRYPKIAGEWIVIPQNMRISEVLNGFDPSKHCGKPHRMSLLQALLSFATNK